MDKEQSEAHASYSSSPLKDEEVITPYVFSSTEAREESLIDIDQEQNQYHSCTYARTKSTYTGFLHSPSHKAQGIIHKEG